MKLLVRQMENDLFYLKIQNDKCETIRHEVVFKNTSVKTLMFKIFSKPIIVKKIKFEGERTIVEFELSETITCEKNGDICSFSDTFKRCSICKTNPLG